MMTLGCRSPQPNAQQNCSVLQDLRNCGLDSVGKLPSSRIYVRINEVLLVSDILVPFKEPPPLTDFGLGGG